MTTHSFFTRSITVSILVLEICHAPGTIKLGGTLYIKAHLHIKALRPEQRMQWGCIDILWPLHQIAKTLGLKPRYACPYRASCCIYPWSPWWFPALTPRPPSNTSSQWASPHLWSWINIKVYERFESALFFLCVCVWMCAFLCVCMCVFVCVCASCLSLSSSV